MHPIVLAQAQAVAACSRQRFARHSHADFGIGRIVSGAQRSWSGRGLVEAGAGDLITCNPGEVHDGRPIGTARAWQMLYLAPALVARLAADIRGGAPADVEFVDPVIRQPPSTAVFGNAWRALTGPAADAAAGEEHLLWLLATLLRQPAQNSRHLPPGLRRARARIDDDPAAAVTLAELAQEAGLSRFQLLRGFARGIGLTPHAYLVQRRLELARRLLATGDGLAQVAAACGFSDQSHLHRSFVARYGLTPGAYLAAQR